MIWIITVAKGRKIAPGRTLSSLIIPQVRMILRIYWTDQYQCRMRGQRTTPGLRIRLARQFDVSVEVIKKVISIRHNQYGGSTRNRFKTIALKSIQRHVKNRLLHRGIPVERHRSGRPRKNPLTETGSGT